MTIRWEEINKDHLMYLEQILQLYDQTFPIEVREPHHIFWRSLQYAESSAPNNYRILIGLKDEQPVSFITGHYLANANAGFIVYLATNPLERSRGLGTQTLLELEELLIKDAILAGNDSLNAIVLETEKQELAYTEAEKEQCTKRERFYERNGFKKYKEISYLQPPLNGGANHVPLNLFIKKRQKMNMTNKEVKNIVRAIYQEKYQLVNGIDEAILNQGLELMGVKKKGN